MEQSTFQPGDACLECHQNGLNHRLRTFFIDIGEQIVKCESSSCLYPYENDLSDSEDENKVEEEQRCSAKPTSLPDLGVISFENEYDDADSVRFVEALLSNSNNNDVEKKNPGMNTKEHKYESEYMNQIITFENKTESTITSNMSHDGLQSNNAVHTESVGFIDSLFSNCEAETKKMCVSNSFKVQPTLPGTAPTFDMPIITFDFSNNPAIVEQKQLPEEKIDTESQIEIQCIQTFKAGLTSTTNEDNITSMPKVSLKSLELSKTEYIKEQSAVQTANKPASEQADMTGSNSGETKVRLSRYFETLRGKQKMFQKTFHRPSLTQRKKPTNIYQQQIPKPKNVAECNLVNVLAMLGNKTQK